MNGKLVAFRADLQADELKHMLPAALESAERARDNLVIPPRGPGLVQLDDLDSTKLYRLAPMAFMTVETSPANYQGWIALEGGTPDIARRLRQGIGADQNASGSVRLAGSRNFKPKYAPHFPVVMVTESTPGRIVSLEEIQRHLAPERTWVQRVTASSPRSWPDYQRCVDGAPPNHSNTQPDVSRADFLYAKISADWGFTPDQIAAKLMEVSSKAKGNERYAIRTAEAATSALNLR